MFLTLSSGIHRQSINDTKGHTPFFCLLFLRRFTLSANGNINLHQVEQYYTLCSGQMRALNYNNMPFCGQLRAPKHLNREILPRFRIFDFFFQSKMTHLYRDKDLLFLKWCQIIYLPVWRSIPTFHCTVSYYHISIYDTTRPS